MFGLITETPQFYNDICEEIRLFFDEKKVDLLSEPGDGMSVRHTFCESEQSYISTAALYRDRQLLFSYTEELKKPEVLNRLTDKKHRKRAVKISVFRLLKGYCQTEMPWGSLTGIRPSKLARELSLERGGVPEAKQAFLELFDVSPEKTELAFEIAANQKQILESVKPGEMDVYVGIPFCVSRCHYCSFASNDIGKCGGQADLYLDRLLYEIKTVLSAADCRIRSVYIGGGTPTALDERQLNKLLNGCAPYFKDAAEYTIEAGRPDTITREKLQIIRDHSIRRLSVNPQTLNDATLASIGRAHTSKEFFDAFDLARSMGFDFINTDIIVGLPGETLADVRDTVSRISELSPENVTVHTLAIKRASKWHEDKQQALPKREEAEKMVELCQAALQESGYHPYYMYRQKYMMGNLENTGYAKPGFDCVYNVDIMEETAGILAFGAGAISKKVISQENRIERAPNVSDLKTYLERTEEMAGRKLALFVK